MKLQSPTTQSANEKTTLDMASMKLSGGAPPPPAAPVKPTPGPGLGLKPAVYLCIETPKQKKHLSIDKVPLRIGRASDCDVVLPYSGISRWHAEINLDALGRLTLSDLNSINGTAVNNRLLTDPRVLQLDDRILIQPITLHVRKTPSLETSSYDGTGSTTGTSVIPSQSGASRGMPLQPDELAFLTRLHHELAFRADDLLGRAELACAALLGAPFGAHGAALLEHPLRGEDQCQVLRHAGLVRPYLSPLLVSKLQAASQPTVTVLRPLPGGGDGKPDASRDAVTEGTHALRYPLSGNLTLAASLPSHAFSKRKQLLFGVVGALLDQFGLHHPESPHRVFHGLPAWAQCSSAIGTYPVRGAHATAALLADNQFLHCVAVACDGIPPEQLPLLPAILAAEILLGRNFTEAQSLHAFCTQVIHEQYPAAKLRGLAVASVAPDSDQDIDQVQFMVSGSAQALVSTDGQLDADRSCLAGAACATMDVDDLLVLRAGESDALPTNAGDSPKAAAHAWASHGIALACKWLAH